MYRFDAQRSKQLCSILATSLQYEPIPYCSQRLCIQQPAVRMHARGRPFFTLDIKAHLHFLPANGALWLSVQNLFTNVGKSVVDVIQCTLVLPVSPVRGTTVSSQSSAVSIATKGEATVNFPSFAACSQHEEEMVA